MLHNRYFSLTLIVINLFIGSTTHCAQSESGQFLLISDIHFDPFYDPEQFHELQIHSSTSWSHILKKSSPPGLNPTGTDSNYALLDSSLASTQARIPNPDFIIFPGDLMAHSWQTKYDKLAKRSRTEDPASYRAFTTKAIQFLADQFRKYYPKTPIFPTLGNDDSYCGDYMITPKGPFLAVFATIWKPLATEDIKSKTFENTVRKGGYYTVMLPAMQNHRLIVLNSIFFSVKYNNACGISTDTPASDEFDWLETTLAAAQESGEKVWLLMHIPPGINSYDSVKNEQNGGSPATFWQPELTSRFIRIAAKYKTTIQMAFAGHTHMDDYRVVQLNDEGLLLSKIAPAISPVFGNNPGYQIYRYSRLDGTIDNFQTFYLTNLETKGSPTLAAKAKWNLEYDFLKTYGLPSLSVESIISMAQDMVTDRSLQQFYADYYTVNAPPAFNRRTINGYRCAILNVTPGSYLACCHQNSQITKPK